MMIQFYQIIITKQAPLCVNNFLYFHLAMRRRIRGILMTGKQFSLDSRMDLVQGLGQCNDSKKQMETIGTDLPGMVEEDVEPGMVYVILILFTKIKLCY